MSNLKVSKEEEKSSTMQIQLRRFIKLIKDNKTSARLTAGVPGNVLIVSEQVSHFRLNNCYIETHDVIGTLHS